MGLWLVCSLRSRRLEVAGERENGLARPFFLVPTTSKRLLRRLARVRLFLSYLFIVRYRKQSNEINISSTNIYNTSGPRPFLKANHFNIHYLLLRVFFSFLSICFIWSVKVCLDWASFRTKGEFYCNWIIWKIQMLLSIVAYSAGFFFKRANVFARESAMLKLQQIGRNWASQRERARGGGLL